MALLVHNVVVAVLLDVVIEVAATVAFGQLLQAPEHKLRKTKETKTENKITPNKD